MKVLVILTFDSSLNTWLESGILSREIKLYEQLNKDFGIEFTFLEFTNHNNLKLISDYKNLNTYSFYKNYKMPKNKIVKFIKSFFVALKISKDFKDFDLIKTNQLNGSWVGIILKFKNKIPLYVRTGYNHYDFEILNKKNILKISFIKLITIFALKYSDTYSVSSVRDHVNINKNFKKFINKDIEILPNWVNHKKQFKNLENRFNNKIMMVGRLEHQKNYLDLITQLKDSKIEIVIFGEGSLKTQISNHAKKNNVKITFKGLIDNLELDKTYEEFIIYVNNSLFEGNSKSTIEAMNSGCVVFAKNIPNNYELIDDGNDGYLYDQINMKLLNKVLQTPESYDYISKNANLKIFKNSLENYVIKEFSIYKKLIS